MFEDPELPDFDSMSQEELIEWLEELANLQGAATSEFIDDAPELDEPGAPAVLDDGADEEWAAWLDDTQSVAAPPPDENDAGAASGGDNFADAEEETPVDLARFNERQSGPLDAEAMAWLAEISAAETEEELPDITAYRPPEAQPENLDELLAQGGGDDPLDWLDNLGGREAGPRLPSPAENERAGAAGELSANPHNGDDFDDAYEDDEKLDDLEDESLYTRRHERSMNVLESILGMEDRESDEYSTQSMAPVPDHVEPAGADEPKAPEPKPVAARLQAAPSASDSLTQAFLLQDQHVDLEAWYKSRLQAIAGPGEVPTPPAGLPALERLDTPTKPPPPGLAAAINSARGKVAADELSDALTDYETLLRTNAGLEWVISDMRGLIARNKFRGNPSVHRVLGDALMRQGHLDAALDVYRHALSLL